MLFFPKIIEQFSFSKPSCPKCCESLSHPHSLPSQSYCPHGSDWLGVDLEVRSLCSWPICQTWNQRIEEGLLSKYCRISTGTDVIRIILVSYNVILLRGLIRPLSMP
jgi:hypothetical protein